jgi:exosortase A
LDSLAPVRPDPVKPVAAIVPAAAWRPALLALGAGLLALGVLFRAEAIAAMEVWNSSTAFGHCYLVLPIAAFLAWERRDALGGLLPRPVPWLALLALPAGLAWLVAARLGVMEGRQLVVVGLVWLLALAVLGWRVGRAMAVPLGYLVFLVPFGAFLVPLLQDFTARFIEIGLTLLDIPHVVTDTLIEIPEGNFRVAEACAGLRFLIAAIAFGTLYACVIYRTTARRVVFIAVSVVVPVLANGVRALGIVLLGHVRGSAEAGAVDHVVYGWLFFSVVILLLLLLGLPFRQDGAPFARPARDARPAAPAWLPGVAMLLLAVLASAGPAAAAWLDLVGQAQTMALAAEAERRAAALGTPPGCVVSPDAPPPGSLSGTRRFVCDGVRLEARVRLFGRLAGPAALAAWRDATVWASEDDAETGWIDRPGARWRLVSTSEPARGVAAALWLGDAPAPSGLALRRALALATAAETALTTVATQDGSPAALAALTRLIQLAPAPQRP